MPQLTTSDWVLLAYIFLLVPLMLIGFGFARRKLFEPNHKLVMTTVTITNWFLIGFVMINTFTRFVEPRISTGISRPLIFLPTLHAFTGIVAQIVASYLVIRMWFENRLPEWFKVKNIKRYMRFTLAMWLTTALLGITVWTAFYLEFRAPKPAGSITPTIVAGTPGATEEATKLAGTPGKTEEATKSAATPGKTEEATKPVATPGKTEEATKPAATTAAAATTVATPAATASK